MSGGYFDYRQRHINEIAESILDLIDHNNDDSVDDWGDTRGRFYSPETIEEFKKAYAILCKAAVYAQRIDWLVSCDDGEDSFHKRLMDELSILSRERKK